MKIKDIIVFAVAFAALGFSIYKKYFQKKDTGQKKGSSSSGSLLSQQPKEDDYEPYSGRK